MAISAATVIGGYAVPSGTTAQGVITVPAGGVPVGATILVYTTSTNSEIVSVVDSAGNTYVSDANYIVANVGILMNLYRVSNCRGLVAGQLITASIPSNSPSAAFGFAAEYYTNLATAAPLNLAVSSGAPSGTSLTSGSTGTPAGVEELVVGFGSWISTAGAAMTVTPGAGYTLNQTVQPSNGNFGLFSESKVVNPATAAQAALATISRTAGWGQICALYKAATGTGGGGGVGGGAPGTGKFGPMIPSIGVHGLIHPHRTRNS